MEYLNGIDSEIFFNKKMKIIDWNLYLGILLNDDGMKYVIPLTSTKNIRDE